MLAKAFSPFVDAAIRSRGEQYFRDGAVQSVELTGKSMTAVVIGSNLYGVMLRRSRQTLFTQCTCPYFEDEFDICKHIWALILEADRRSAFRLPRPPSSLELDFPDSDLSDDYIVGDLVGFDETVDESHNPDGDLAVLDAGMERALYLSGSLPRYNLPFRPLPGRTPKATWEPALAAVLSASDTRPEQRLTRAEFLTPGTEIRYVLDGEKSSYEIVIVPEFSRPKKSGDGTTMFRSLTGLVPEAVERLPDEADRNLMLLVLTRMGAPNEIRLPFAAAGLVLEQVCATGRFYFRQWKNATVAGPLVWGGAEPFRLTLHCSSTDADWVIAGDLRRGDERLVADDLIALLPQARLAITKQCVCHRLEAPSPAAFSSLTPEGVIRVPKRATDEFVSLLARLPAAVPFELPDELGWTERQCAPRPVLVIGRPSPWSQGTRAAELHFEYEGHRIGALDARSRIEVGKREVIVRDQAAEAKLRTRAEELGLRVEPYDGKLVLHESRFSPLVLALAQGEWLIEVEGRRQRVWSGLDLELVSEIDWFDVRGGLEFGEQVISLPELLDTVRKGTPLTLADGSVGLIPSDLIKLSSSLQSLGTREEGTFRFRKSQGAMLDALLEGDERVRVDEGFKTFRNRLREFDGVKPAEPPDHCELEGRQKALYDELRDYYRKSLADTIERQGLAKSKIHVLEALLRLRQAACHPGLVRKGIKDAGCAKLETLLPRLSEIVAEGHKVLVFSQFTSFLAIVREALDTHEIPHIYLDGATTNRRELVNLFQSEAGAHVFLISLKAGGLGLNLTAAEYVFLLDPWWNPAVEAQAIDRTHRIGQTKNVFAYRIVARDTIEEKILALQQSKRELADAILGEDKSLIRKLTREDLEFLLA